MAPEQCFGATGGSTQRSVRPRIVLWEMSTMHRLYKGKTTHEVMQTIITSTPPKPNVGQPYIPNELELITLKALARDPIKRYQSAPELAGALETLGRSLGGCRRQLARLVRSRRTSRRAPRAVARDTRSRREAASVDFDRNDASNPELEVDTQKDIPARHPAKPEGRGSGGRIAEPGARTGAGDASRRKTPWSSPPSSQPSPSTRDGDREGPATASKWRGGAEGGKDREPSS